MKLDDTMASPAEGEVGDGVKVDDNSSKEAPSSAVMPTKNVSEEADATNNETEAPPPAAAATSSRFFSRIGSIGDNATANLILSRAQKLRAQAVSEVDRLRQQQQSQQQSQETTDQVDTNNIPPAVGTLIDGEAVKEEPQQPDAAINADEGGEEASVKSHTDEPMTQEGGSEKTTTNVIGTPKRSNAVTNDTSKKQNLSPLRSAFNVVRTTGADAAKNLIFPPTVFASSNEEDDDDDNGGGDDGMTSPDDKREDDEGTQEDGNSSLTSRNSSTGGERSSAPSLSGQQQFASSTPVKSFVNAYSEFRTVGRYRMMKDNEPPQNVITAHDPKNVMHMTPQQNGSTPVEKRKLAKQMSASPVVGGADRVVGLRFLNWDKVVGPINEKKEVSSSTSSTPTLPMDKSLHSSTDPTTVTTKNDDDTATVSTNVDVTDTASTVTSVTASEDDKSSSGHLTSIPKTMKEGTRTGVSYYEDVVRSTLKPGQRAMFFGTGVLGIIMKPTYLASWRGVDGQGLLSATTAAKKGGVFVDSMIRGSQAYLSGVVHVGDHIVRIGTVDVSNMTLEEVVDVIANSRRPNIMVVTAVHDIELVSVSGDKDDISERRFTSSLDLVYGFVNKIATEGEGSVTLKENQGSSLLDDSDDNNIEEEVLFGAETTEEDDADDKGAKPEGNKADSVPVETVTVAGGSNNVGGSKDDVIDTLSFYASRRTNGHSAQKLPVILERVALTNSEFRAALQRSLVECCSDPRRSKFLKCYFNRYESRREVEQKKKKKEKRFKSISHALRRETNDKDVTSSHIQKQLLELYLELLQFHDATLICSESDRERLLTRARYISTRFLAFGSSENSSTLPEFVADAALGGVEAVVSVRRAIEDEDDFFDCEDGDGFSCIRSSLESFLSLQESYLGFLISDVCARMRAYMRGSAPFIQVDPLVFLSPGAGADAPSQNFLLHAILHLVCMKENGDGDDIDCIKNDAINLNKGNRNTGAVSLLSCAIFIARSLQKSSQMVVEGLIEDGMTGKMSNGQLYSKLMEDFQYLWDVFIAPAGGSLSTLSLSVDAEDSLNSVRRLLVSSVDAVLAKNEPSEISAVSIARALTSVELTSSVHGLREALFREYTLNTYPVFRRHIFHEWACQEAKQNRFARHASSDKYLIPSSYNGMAKGSVKRFLRQVELPIGVSLHRPSPKIFTSGGDQFEAQNSHQASSVALVFGTDAPTDSGSVTSSSESDRSKAVRRFAAVSLQAGGLVPNSIPPVFESYAVVPPFHERPFLGTLRDEKNHRITVDGWEVSLTNFMLPSGSSGMDGNEWLYCVSLVFRKPRVSIQSKRSRKYLSEQEVGLECVNKLVSDESVSQSRSDINQEFQSPLVETESDGVKSRKMIVSSEPSEFNRKLQEQRWSQSVDSSSDVIVGLAVVSDRNETYRMRETLSTVFSDFCRKNLCQPLVDILGNFSNSCVEETCLQSILEPYLSFTAAKWVDRPIRDQELQFSEVSGTQLMQSLPAVPLALLFVTILLEQKVVLASSRRGMLMAASDAIMQLLKPLQWKHLLVPLVPESMMNDLVHYPAPFILGIPTDEKKSAEILSSLPGDVTLVDLDVGRVMLASEFVHDDSSASDGPGAAAGALRSQVLFLAESLGGIVGGAVDDSWASDSPLQIIPHDNNNKVDDFVSIRNICHDFILELLSGVHSCCLWIEEKCVDECTNGNEPAIVFDEKRFLSIKSLRSEGLNLSLFQDKQVDGSRSEFCLGTDKFDLILDAFLRTQSLSNYISHGEKELMMFW
ncbi:DENN domain-containing protein [Skeletonema marinoi]|uniref:DENN domain-containing protein n=1 Tax=Skeletonema marinoi TaxID=267567 RepID=A0AAD8YJK2_9STRA|nr:DENN domain-containing protein [Skeletonema marinoi]